MMMGSVLLEWGVARKEARLSRKEGVYFLSRGLVGGVGAMARQRFVIVGGSGRGYYAGGLEIEMTRVVEWW